MFQPSHTKTHQTLYLIIKDGLKHCQMQRLVTSKKFISHLGFSFINIYTHGTNIYKDHVSDNLRYKCFDKCSYCQPTSILISLDLVKIFTFFIFISCWFKYRNFKYKPVWMSWSHTWAGKLLWWGGRPAGLSSDEPYNHATQDTAAEAYLCLPLSH